MRHTFNLVEVYCLDIRFLSARQCHIPHLSPSRPILIDQLRVCFCSVLGRNSQCQGMYTFNKEVEGQKLLAPAVHQGLRKHTLAGLRIIATLIQLNICRASAKRDMQSNLIEFAEKLTYL